MANIPVPEIDPASLQPTIRHLAERGALLNVFKMFLSAPEIGTALIEYGYAHLAHSTLSPVDREITILVTGRCCECEYETAQHEPISRAAGVTDRQRSAIAKRQWKSPAFTESQIALIRFVVSILQSPTVPQETMDAIRSHYSDRQVVELVMLTGCYFTLARVATAFDIEIDQQEDTRIIDAATVIGRRTE